MANADAQFIFETNLPQVRQEIQTELGRISAAVAESSGAQGGDFLGGLTKGLTGDVSRAIAEIRRIKAEAEEAVTSGGTIATGKAPAAMQFNDVITGLQKQVEDRVRKAALNAGSDLGQLDLRAIMAEIDQAFTKKARDQARALVRDIERTGSPQAQAVYGSSRDIPTGVPRTTLTTPADVQQQAADEKRARRESAAAARRLAKSTEANAAALDEQTSDTQQETSQRRGRRQRLASSENALAAANEQAAASTKDAASQKVVKVDLAAAQQTDSRRVLKGIGSDDPNFGYANRAGTPSATVVDRTNPTDPRFFRQSGTGYEEIEKGTSAYTTALNTYRLQLQDRAKREADAAKAQEKADADLLKAKQTYSQKIQSGLAAQNPNYGYITKSGDQGKYAFDDPNSLNPRISKNVGTAEQPNFSEVDQSSKDYAYQLGRLRGILADRAQAEQEAARAAAEFAATQAEAKAALSQQIRDSLIARDGQYDYLSKGKTPTKDVYTGTDRDNLTLYRQDASGGFDELTPAHKDYVATLRRAQDAFDREAQATKDATASEKAASDALAAAKVAQAKSADVAAKLAAGNASVQYLSDNGRPTGRVAVGVDGQAPRPGTATYYQQQGSGYAEIPRTNEAGEADARYVAAENSLTATLNARNNAEVEARKASERLAESQRQSAATAVGAASGGGGGFGGGVKTGLFSGGFGDNGEAGAYGIGRALGTTVKYDLLYKTFNGLLTILGQVSQEFLNVDDSVVQLSYAMGDGADVSNQFIGRLQDVAAPGGFNVGDAMDQAAASIRAYRDEILNATDATGQFLDTAQRKQLGEDIGTNFTKAATQVAVLGQTTLADANQNNRATALGFGLNPVTGASQVADAVANANLIGGGLPKDISQGGANIAEIAHAAGFSLQEALSVVSKISADTDQSGQLSASRVSRLVGTLQGTSGKNYLTQLNQSLPQDQRVDINASPRDQVLQLSAAYSHLNDAQKQQVATAIAGTAQQREFNVLMQSFPQIVKDSANAKVGLADKQYQDSLNNVRGLLGQIRGELRGIITNLAESGIAAPIGGLLKILLPILQFARSITSEFNKLPGIVRDIGLGFAGVLLTLKGIDALKGAGGGSLTGGFKNLLNNTEGALHPQAQFARQQLSFQGAETNRAVAFSSIGQQELEGTLTAGDASRARIQAEKDYQNEIRAATANYKREVKLGATAIADGAEEMAGETKKGAATWREDFRAGATGVRAAVSEFVAAIRGGAAEVGAADAGRAATGVVGGLGGAAAAEEETAVAATARRGAGLGGKIGGSIGRGASSVIGGVGALFAPEVLAPMLAIAGVEGAMSVNRTSDTVDAAQRGLNSAASANVKAGAAGLTDAASQNAEAAKTMREAASGFGGTLYRLIGNIVGVSGNPEARAAGDAQTVSTEQTALANRLNNQQTTGITQTGTRALASEINTATGADITSSVQNLLAAGQSASSVLDALSLTLKNLKFAATGTIGELTGLQQTDLAGRMGIAAGKAAPESRDALQQQINNETDPQQRATLQTQLDAVNKIGQKGITDTTSSVLADFFKKNPNASLNDPKVGQDIRKRIFDQLTAQGLDKGTSAIAGLNATRDLGQERQKFLAALATPEVAGALVDSTISTAQVEQQRVQSNAQLKAMRTGAPDRSATAGLKAYQARLQASQATLQQDIEAMNAAGLDSSALQLQTTKLQNALTDTQIKILQQAAADAKDTIDTLERRRLALQAGVSSNAQVKAIGDQIVAQELKAAIDSGDPDQIRRVMQLASNAEIDTYMRQLDANIAADQAAVDAENKRDKAQAILAGTAASGPAGPSKPAPPAHAPAAPAKPNIAPNIAPNLAPQFDLPAGPTGPTGPITGAPPATPAPAATGATGPAAPAPKTAAQRKLDAAKAARDRLNKLRGQVTPTGTAETGADVPGGTPEERQAAALAAQAEKDRNSSEAAAAKVAAAKAAMDKISDHSTQQYKNAQQQYYAALNAQADLQQDTAISSARAALFPGDKVGAAKLALDDATNQVSRFAQGSKEYWDAVAKQKQAQYDYATAQREQANLIAETHIDLTDPVQVAIQALRNARAKLAYDQAHGADQGTIAGDKVDVANKAAGQDSAKFSQQMSDMQTAEELGRISHTRYLQFLEAQHDRLTAQIAGMKKTDQGYRQAIDQLNQVDKDIKAANQQLTGQFNLGDIKVPTVYEVRRSIQAQAAGSSASAISNTAVANSTTNNVTVNGADFARVTAWLQQIFGKTARITTTPRKA